jgi:predicted acetyltransferase
MDLQVRAITDAEVPAWCEALNTGFLNPAGDVDAEVRRSALILDRTLAGFDGDRIVSTLRSFPTEVTVPGGAALTASAVTAVTTTSTHRRRGLASRMIAAELAGCRERGEPISVLIAAEWPIYGRFGYGAATESQTWTVNARSAQLRRRPVGTVEYVARDEARAAMPAIYDRHRRASPGELARDDRFFDIDFGLLRYPSWPEPKSAFHVLARDGAGTPIGVASYHVEEKWEQRQPAAPVSVQLLFAATAEGEVLLWHHLMSLDLVATVTAEDRSTEALLPWLLVDARHAQAGGRSDFLWLRPLDVPRMLRARSYPVAAELVLEVDDRDGFAAGRFALSTGPDGPGCEPTSRPADLTLDAATLGSLYLGGHRPSILAAAGLITEHTGGAVYRAEDLFRSHVTPWCSTWF